MRDRFFTYNRQSANLKYFMGHEEHLLTKYAQLWFEKLLQLIH